MTHQLRRLLPDQVLGHTQSPSLKMAAAKSKPANYKLMQTQEQVNEVVGIMRNNVEKVLERDQKLGDLEDRSDALRDGAQRFEKKAVKLKRKMWWKNMKFMLILAVIVIILILIIVLIIIKS